MRSDFSMAASRRMEAPGNIRAGSLTRGSRGSILNDEEDVDVINAPHAVVVLLQRGDRFLAVSRGPDASDMNLPGGKVEIGEELMDAAHRELQEETGIRARHLIPVYEDLSDNGFIVTVFRAKGWDGQLSPSEEGVPDWVEAEELLVSRYGDFFRRLTDHLKIELLSL